MSAFASSIPSRSSRLLHSLHHTTAWAWFCEHFRCSDLTFESVDFRSHTRTALLPPVHISLFYSVVPLNPKKNTENAKTTTRTPKALDTYADLDRTIGVDGYTVTAVIDVLRRLGDWHRALPLLDRLAGLGVSADQGLRTSVNAVLSAMGPDNYRRAKELVEKAALDWGVGGDIVTYGTLLLLASARLPPPAPLSSGAAVVLPAAAAVAVEPRAGRLGGVNGGLLEEGEATGSREEGKWETVNVFWTAVEAKAVPSEACLDMVVFALARDGLWEEASAFVQAIEEAGLTVSRHQVGLSFFLSFMSGSRVKEARFFLEAGFRLR